MLQQIFFETFLLSRNNSFLLALLLSFSHFHVKPFSTLLLNYSKEWDDKLEVWKTTPLHDEYSHGADVLRQIAMDNGKGFVETPDMVERSSGFAV